MSDLFDPARLPPREDGYTFHPDLPDCDDEDDPIEPRLHAIGWCITHVDYMTEDLEEADLERYELGDESVFRDWTPRAPADGSRLAAIYGSEDGQCAVWVGRIGKCVGCGCTDIAPCPHAELPCYWRRVDRTAGTGVCSCCAQTHVEAWDAAHPHNMQAAAEAARALQLELPHGL